VVAFLFDLVGGGTYTTTVVFLQQKQAKFSAIFLKITFV